MKLVQFIWEFILATLVLRTGFEEDNVSAGALLAKNDTDKNRGRLRITYQRPENPSGPCGRTFEDAFMLANIQKFGLIGTTSNELELNARVEAAKVKKIRVCD